MKLDMFSCSLETLNLGDVVEVYGVCGDHCGAVKDLFEEENTPLKTVVCNRKDYDRKVVIYVKHIDKRITEMSYNDTGWITDVHGNRANGLTLKEDDEWRHIR